MLALDSNFYLHSLGVKEGHLGVKQQQLLGARWTRAYFVLT